MTPFEALRFLGCCLSATAGGPGSVTALKQRITGQDIDWPAVVSVADRHFVLPLLHSLLKAKNLDNLLPKDLRDTLSTLYRLNRQRTKRLKVQLAEVLRSLNAVGVSPLLLKGAAVLYSDIYPDPACRMMNDLDLLVPADRLQVCVNTLREAGYVPMDEFDLPGWHFHSPALAHSDHIARVELHRELFLQPYTRLLDAKTVLKNAILMDRRDQRFHLCTTLDSAMYNISSTYQLSTISIFCRYCKHIALGAMPDKVATICAEGNRRAIERNFPPSLWQNHKAREPHTFIPKVSSLVSLG